MHWFNIERPLYKNGWTGLAVFIPLLIALVMAGYIAYQNNLCFSHWTSLALETFFENQKLPLAIFSLIIPLIGLVVAAHRSALTIKQMQTTDDQIQATKVQNTFVNYFKHREEFFKFLDTLESKFNVKFKSRNELYKNLYPKNSQTNVQIQSHSKNEEDRLDLVDFVIRLNQVVSDFKEQCLSHYELYNSKKATEFSLTEKTLSGFYSDILSHCNKYLFLEPKKPTDDDIERTQFKDIRPFGKSYIPTKTDEPLYFLGELHEIITELFVFAELEAEPLVLFKDNKKVNSVIKMQYNVLMKINPETFPIR